MIIDANGVTAFFTAIAAIGGLYFSARGLWQQSKALDAENLLRVMDIIFEAERQFATIKTVSDSDKRWIINEHFNRLEAISCLYNNELVNKHSREWCKDVLINNLGSIQIMPSLHDQFQHSVTKPDTYKEIMIFLKRHRREIDAFAQTHRPAADPLEGRP